MKNNIDKIIDNSLKKTAEIEKQLKSIEDKFNLNSVSLTGDDDNHKTSIYQMDGELISRKQISNAQNKLSNFIDIGPRKKPGVIDNLRNANALQTDNKLLPKEPKKKQIVKGWKH